VAYAHSQGVIHRDLKPKNVMLGPFDETLVVDWGLAKRFAVDGSDERARECPAHDANHGDNSLSADVLGTPGYLSPEQARCEPVGPASDVYSLGATLYAMLTGRPPLRGENVHDTLERTRSNRIAPVRSLNPSAPAALEAICNKALAPCPNDRYGSALALAADVDRWLADEPVSVLRDSMPTRFLRWGRRNRPAVTGVMALILAGFVGLAALAAVQARANVRLTEAKKATDNALDAALTATKQADSALAAAQESRKQTEALNTFLTHRNVHERPPCTRWPRR
jgi:eukaryotic-like serine/threonine-protein kinase